ncbi:MAG: aspartyl-tRNA(Asn)/glutamyl-tRNA(Gln) amidotransferase subunit [Chloroflexia bacterium]|jgi:aspartyl-tRNA(Asn)/glutamyl-tRNA(Gln) amidotransferase subunit A|nr:aspartyl-tRNA(Asn)/glutamyl-tRNA(Gln) amidotransferase subunit [Chloroflexia bacterium]
MSSAGAKQSLAFLTIHEAREMLDSGQVSSEELTRAALSHIDNFEDEIHAYVSLTRARALESAGDFDRRRAAGESPRSALDGIPMSLKDVLITRGVTTTCGSRHLENFVPPFDGTVPARLFEIGAVLLGKNNCDEFAMGSSTENSAWGVSRNPWDTSRVPGGSSGGSAAAVAAGMGLYSLGTDTGGSVRQPASLCGLTGLKPTYGRVSRYGLVAFASSLDQIGPFTHDALDAALVLEVIAGQDPCDSTSQPVEVPSYSAILRESGDSLSGLRVGVRRGALDATGSSDGGLNPEVAAAVQTAVRQLTDLGAELREIDLPNLDYALAAYYIIAPAEASSNLARYDGMKYGYRDPEARSAVNSMLATREYGFGPEVKRRIMLGTYALSAGYYEAFYKKAQQVRTLVAQDFKRAFEQVDVILDPTSPTVAFKIGEKLDDPLAMYLTDIYTVPANLAGVPGISIPCGFSDGLPIGLQILGRHFDEATILRVAHAYQQVTDWHRRTPQLIRELQDQHGLRPADLIE